MRKKTLLAAIRAAFPPTIPILTGYLFVGIAFGVYMRSLGLPPFYPILMSALIFAGSMQFVAGSFLVQSFAPVSAFVTTLAVNARHIFYGLSLLEKYRDMGKKKPLAIFMLTDETFSVNCAVAVPEGVDKGWFYFFTSLFDYAWWLIGTALGTLAGEVIPFDTTGIEFVMTALFIVLFIERWLSETNHVSALGGLGISLLALVIFGAERFLLAAMAGILALLTTLKFLIKANEGGTTE